MLVFSKLARLGSHRNNLAQSIGNISKMRQRARKMPLLDVEVQILIVTALDSLDEICEVGLIFTTTPFAKLITLVIKRNA